MHIPDGWVDPFFLILTWVITIFVIFISLQKLKDIDETRLTYMSVLGGTIFAAQMLNFPIIGGTSGHLLGATLATSIVGPWGGILVITTVLIIQAFIFADGGVITLGANIFNMGIVGVFVSYLILRSLMLNSSPEKKFRYYSGVFLAAFFSVTISSVFAALEIGFPVINNVSQVHFFEVLPLIVFFHTLIGIGEGIITVAIVTYFHSIEMDVFIDAENRNFNLDFINKG